MDTAGRERKPFLFGIGFEMEEGFFIADPLSQQDVLFNINGISNATAHDGPAHDSPLHDSPLHDSPIVPFHFASIPEDYHTYRERFHTVMNGLKRGDSYLTNLTIKTPLETSLSLSDIYRYSHARYKLHIPQRLVCFSPECFVRMHPGKIVTYPMKGTIDAGIPNARERIMNDLKETAEHNTIVDLLRNDLSRIASQVSVTRFRYIEELQTTRGPLLQVSSEIEGRLTKAYPDQAGSLFFALLPAGSVSGAPKRATLELIRRAEGEPRGYYTGVAGYFDGETLESFVLIRYIEQGDNRLYFRSGGGITAHSVCRNEYREAIQKIYLPFTSA